MWNRNRKSRLDKRSNRRIATLEMQATGTPEPLKLCTFLTHVGVTYKRPLYIQLAGRYLLLLGNAPYSAGRVHRWVNKDPQNVPVL